jgi:hypothetical protein
MTKKTTFKQLLMEAVKAVQRGEMSVHRAGSYYGVPHSTLEYKVKERHLLRQKKIKEQKEAAARACCNFLSNSEAGILKAYPDEPKKLISDAPPRLEDVEK